MSKGENLELAHRIVEAWNAHDLDAFLAELDPDVEWHPSIEPALEGAESVYRGYDGARRAWRQYHGEGFMAITVRAEELRDLGDRVLVLGYLDLTGHTTGIEFGQEFGGLYDLREGKVVRAQDFLSHAEALKVAGLSE